MVSSRHAKHLGILPQSSQLTFPFSASEVVAMGATPLSLSADELAQQTRFWMEKTDTWQFADRFFTSLSGGERQRVQLARILLRYHKPKNHLLFCWMNPHQHKT
ncbi:ATP-binding cassette domain-containing protein [Shewanella glacialipiscicola]|uniref:ATP-binding cassette domain-containing protein n=1 Tax=Shewanella glacialipiscicola TaxID=614069 RepID=UPI003D67C99E